MLKRMYDIIDKKKIGKELSDVEIRYLINGYVYGCNPGSVPTIPTPTTTTTVEEIEG